MRDPDSFYKTGLKRVCEPYISCLENGGVCQNGWENGLYTTWQIRSGARSATFLLDIEPKKTGERAAQGSIARPKPNSIIQFPKITFASIRKEIVR